MSQKWIQAGVLGGITLFLVQCTPWYELDYQMQYAKPQSVEIRQRQSQSMESDFGPLQNTRPEIQLASQSNGTIPISPEEELELIVSQFASQGRPLPPQLEKNNLESATSAEMADGYYLEQIVSESGGRGRRFVIRLNHLAQYRANTIEEPNHFRLYIDFFNTQLAAAAQKISIGKGAIYQIRSGQFSPSTARVVFDSRTEIRYQIHPDQLQNSLVVDLEPATCPDIVPIQDASSHFSVNKAAERAFSDLGVVQELGLKIRRIIIDPGHGGTAPGAVGPSGLKEKDVVFAIAQWLYKLLNESGEYEAVLTRESDRDVALEERTQFANSQQGDLFVSIHVNASKHRYSQGIETYYLSLAKDNASRSVAAFENQSANGEISNLDHVVTQILKTSKVKESALLAQTVQRHLVGRTQLYDGGVRHAGFVVLIGAQMPAILVEAGYLSNPVEEQMMYQSDYHRRVAQAIFEGIQSYRQQSTMVAEKVQSLW